jgi:hypothetical protein
MFKEFDSFHTIQILPEEIGGIDFNYLLTKAVNLLS